MWHVGDVCFVAGEGDELFVIEATGRYLVHLFGHGVERLENLRRPSPAELEQALEDTTARLALLQVQALQVSLAILKATP